MFGNGVKLIVLQKVDDRKPVWVNVFNVSSVEWGLPSPDIGECSIVGMSDGCSINVVGSAADIARRMEDAVEQESISDFDREDVQPKKSFLECMFNNLDDIGEGTDEEVRRELEEMGVDIEGAKKRFGKLLKKLNSERKQKKN